LVIGLIENLQNVTTNNYDSFTEFTHPKDNCNYNTPIVFLVFISRCLVAVFNGGRSPSSGFPNSPRPQQPASHFSQLQLSTDSTQVKFKFMLDRRSVGQCVLVSSTHLGPKTRFLLLSDSCGFVDVGVHSLTSGRVCRLQFLPGLASAVILGSESRGTHDHILLSEIRDSPKLVGQVTVFISPRNWVPFSSPPTTRRATVEVFEPISCSSQLLLVFSCCRF
jgi:hypothetical protein